MYGETGKGWFSLRVDLGEDGSYCIQALDTVAVGIADLAAGLACAADRIYLRADHGTQLVGIAASLSGVLAITAS